MVTTNVLSVLNPTPKVESAPINSVLGRAVQYPQLVKMLLSQLWTLKTCQFETSRWSWSVQKWWFSSVLFRKFNCWKLVTKSCSLSKNVTLILFCFLVQLVLKCYFWKYLLFKSVGSKEAVGPKMVEKWSQWIVPSS